MVASTSVRSCKKFKTLALAAAIFLLSTSPAIGMTSFKEIIMEPTPAISSFAEVTASMSFFGLEFEGAGSGFKMKRMAKSVTPNRHFSFSAKKGTFGKGHQSLHITMSRTRTEDGLEETSMYELRLGIALFSKRKTLHTPNKLTLKMSSIKDFIESKPPNSQA